MRLRRNKDTLYGALGNAQIHSAHVDSVSIDDRKSLRKFNHRKVSDLAKAYANLIIANTHQSFICAPRGNTILPYMHGPAYRPTLVVIF